MQLDDWENILGSWTSSTTSSSDERVYEFLVSIEETAMACQFEVLLHKGEYETGVESAHRSLEAIHRLEAELSVYRPQSDFSSINRWAAERPIPVRSDVFQLLNLALDTYSATGGAFDVTAGSLSEAWGFSRREGRRPSESEICEALQRVGSQYISLDAATQSVRLLRPGVKLNPGGIGKGFALDRVAQGLAADNIENFLLHGGLSSICARGSRKNGAQGQGWWIALAHPLRWEEKLGMIRLRNQALGTSGAGKQFFHYQGVRYSHIIDPRTGYPAQGVLSATVVCRSGALADALATALFVMGPNQAREFCEKHPNLTAVLVSTEPDSNRLKIERFNLSDEDWRDAKSI